MVMGFKSPCGIYCQLEYLTSLSDFAPELLPRRWRLQELNATARATETKNSAKSRRIRKKKLPTKASPGIIVNTRSRWNKAETSEGNVKKMHSRGGKIVTHVFIHSKSRVSRRGFMVDQGRSAFPQEFSWQRFSVECLKNNFSGNDHAEIVEAEAGLEIERFWLFMLIYQAKFAITWFYSIHWLRRFSEHNETFANLHSSFWCFL